MKKTIKNKILIPLIVLFTLSIALLSVFTFAPKSAEATFVGDVTEARLPETKEDTKSGMRFVSYLPTSEVSAYGDYTITYGTFIMPAYYAERKGTGLTEESLGLNGNSNPSFIFDQNEDTSLEVNQRPWRINNIVCKPAVKEIDGVENYVIKASVNMNIAKNLNTKYTYKAYFKAVKGEEVIYVLADETSEDKSLLDIVIPLLNNEGFENDEVKFNKVNTFISDYVDAVPEKANVSYSIVHKYNGSEEVEAYAGTAQIGADLSEIIANNDDPTNDTASGLQRDYNYYYNNGNVVGGSRALADGSTKIVIDFAYKTVYQNKANPAPLALTKFNSDMTGNEPYADSYEVEVKNGENVKTATVLRSEIESLSKGYTTLLKQFPKNEPVVYETYVKVYTAFIGSKAELEKIHLLPDDYSSDRFAQGDRFLVTSDIDMTGYTRGYSFGATGYPASGYHDRGFRGIIDGDGHVLYNLSTRLFDILGVHSQLNNLTIIGTALTKSDIFSVALLGRAMYGEMHNCHIDVTVPSGVNTSGTNYTPSILFDHVHKQSTYVPRFVNTVIRVDNSVGLDAAVLGNGTSTVFENTFIYTNAENVFRPGEDTNDTAPSINGLNADFTSDAEVREIFVNAGWTLESKLPALNGRVISHAETSYSQYRLNDDNNPTDRISNGDKEVNVDNINYVVPEATLLSQANGKATHFVKSGDDFGFITVDKVTARLSTENDLKYFFYLAGGATPTEVAIQGGGTGYKYGAGELFILDENIDMSGVTPVTGNALQTTGTWGVAGFHGTIDGNGHTITNLKKPLVIGMGNSGIIKNLSLVSDNLTEASFLGVSFGTVDNCYFDIVNSGSGASMLANYGYGSKWTNNVFKITNLNVKGATNSSTHVSNYICNNLNNWDLTNSIVITNGETYYGTLGGGSIKVLPTVTTLDSVTDAIVSNFLANGANTNIWTDSLGFNNFTVTNDYKAWAKYNYGDENCTSRVANGEGFTDGVVSIDNATLASLYEGSLYLADSNYTNNSFSRTMVRIATIIANTPKQFANLIYACGSSAGAAGRFAGYVILGSDLDMTGVNFSLAQSAWSGHHYDDRAFDGVIDGNGYTVYNNGSVMFINLGGTYGAVVKNFKLDSATKPIAGTLGKVTFDNCDLDFEFTALGYHGGAAIYGAIADSICGTKTANINNTTIKVINLIDSTIYVIKDNTDDNEATPGVANFNNVTILADEANVGVTSFDISSSVARGEAVKKYYTTPEKLYYGRYAFNRVDGVKDRTTRVINTFALEGQLSTGEFVNITDAHSKLGLTGDSSNGNINVAGGYKQTLTKIRGSKGNYYDIAVYGAWGHVVDAEDVAYIKTLLGQGWQVAQATVQTIGFNADIDMKDITSIDYGHTSSGESWDWGWKGQIFGNNKTISNLNVPLVGYTNAACTIQDLIFKNIGQNGCLTAKSSGGNFNNLTFDFDASNMSNIKVLLSETNNNRGSSTEAIFNNLTVNVTGAKPTFVLSVSRGPNMGYTPGAVRVNSATVTMDNGKFSIGRLDVPSAWTDTTLTSGPVTNKVVSGVFNIDNTFTNTTVE